MLFRSVTVAYRHSVWALVTVAYRHSVWALVTVAYRHSVWALVTVAYRHSVLALVTVRIDTVYVYALVIYVACSRSVCMYNSICTWP